MYLLVTSPNSSLSVSLDMHARRCRAEDVLDSFEDLSDFAAREWGEAVLPRLALAHWANHLCHLHHERMQDQARSSAVSSPFSVSLRLLVVWFIASYIY
jgi:hypothetical protein